MKLRYFGPPRLKEIVQEICLVSDSDFHRDSLFVAVSTDDPFGDFTSPRELNQELDRSIATLDRVQGTKHKVPSVRERRRFDAARNFLNSVDEFFRKGAYYHNGYDSIFMNPYNVVAYWFNLTKGSDLFNSDEGDPIDVLSHLKHERVHHDLGTCRHSQDVRRWYSCLEQTALATPGYASPARRNWVTNYRSLIPFEGTIHNALALEERKAQLEQLRDQCGLKTAEEALAYNVWGGRSLYAQWLEEEGYSRDMLGFFDRVSKVLREEGCRDTIARMRVALDEAYAERVPVVDVF